MTDVREGHINCDNAAVMKGYTRHVIVASSGYEFAALVRPEADLDGDFKAFDTDNQEWLLVYGWSCDVYDAD